MNNAERLDAWLETVTAHNHANHDAWTARFEIDGVRLVEQAVKRLAAIGVTMGPNGGPLEYIATFTSANAREVAAVLVDEGAWICSDQTRAPVP